ncbi:DNA-directed RNA polymerase III subunit RPC8 isoform X1 [Suricata suricatta]|uniref:DNA-directed RNA polymerase subunit n=1 Tax=Suricata suricatta TaxID=37032 RepID=A0A673VGD7_SURSU|nr:DNA-directed RNA polymerase III subunit RPC8 isoform X1 [Suricata suricatta]XP_029809382.1 DNA-directed RNA polymerase III subunit RPC8 isoform X1 [Suricata suricatta]
MFVLVEMVDTVRIPPWQFERKLNDSIAEELNKKLANKVVYNVGLCICLFDITKLEDAYVFPGDGASHTKVHFRYVVFHPFLDEILIGKIKGCSPEGVHVSLGFFDDILIPPESLQQPAKFDEAEQVWVWEYETEEGAHDLYMDTGEEIRFRVVDESFVDTSPTGPSSAEATSSSEELPKKEAPYTLVLRVGAAVLRQGHPVRPWRLGLPVTRISWQDLAHVRHWPAGARGIHQRAGPGPPVLVDQQLARGRRRPRPPDC